MNNIATRRLCPPARLPSPGEQLLWLSAMSTGDLRDDRVRSQRLPSTASALSPSDHRRRPPAPVITSMRRNPEPFGSSEGSSVDTSLISKSGDQTRRFHRSFEGGAVTALTADQLLSLCDCASSRLDILLQGSS